MVRAVLKCAWRCNYVLCKVNILQTCLHDLHKYTLCTEFYNTTILLHNTKAITSLRAGKAG